jgi:hypothetical protein
LQQLYGFLRDGDRKVNIKFPYNFLEPVVETPYRLSISKRVDTQAAIAYSLNTKREVPALHNSRVSCHMILEIFIREVIDRISLRRRTCERH